MLKYNGGGTQDITDTHTMEGNRDDSIHCWDMVQYATVRVDDNLIWFTTS